MLNDQHEAFNTIVFGVTSNCAKFGVDGFRFACAIDHGNLPFRFYWVYFLAERPALPKVIKAFVMKY